MQENYFKRYETFLQSIDLDSYTALRKIKTVEQDLPKSLNPLPLIYRFYWEEKNFIGYDEFFEIYWKGNLNSIIEFVKKYFYGCSLQFVEEGFRARIFRTWVSLLTQFHFQYLWQELFQNNYPLNASADLDMLGIDALVEVDEVKVGIQIKKVSFRREASQRRFTKKQRKLVDMICEVPYLVLNLEELERKLESPRTRENTKKRIRLLLNVFNRYFKVFNNNFVVFKRSYVETVLSKIRKSFKIGKNFIPYTEFLEEQE